jgi:hypothetical protein
MDFLGNQFFRVFELPLLRNAQKNTIKINKKSIKTKQVSSCFVVGLRQMYVAFVIFVFTALLINARK